MMATQVWNERTVPGTVMGGGRCETPVLDGLGDVQATAHTLPEGTRLLDYDIVGPIGEGGFGIVYLAWDPALQVHVAIKEYLPAVLASRASISQAVVVKSQRHVERFRNGMRSFVNEARMLAQFDHPSLVKVLHFWEGNGTAYMAMPYYAGPTLARALADLGRPPTEAEITAWLHPLLDALGTLHAASCFHRDIAPDNILLTDAGPVLLDFGAARRVVEGTGPSPTVVFKPGFAPIEQYGEVAAMRQGAWTDLYALAGVVHAAITGRAPQPSIERLVDDRLQPLSGLALGRYSAAFLAAVDDALSLYPCDRPQSVDDFRARLGGTSRVVPAAAAALARAKSARASPPPVDWPPLRAAPVSTPPARQQHRRRVNLAARAAMAAAVVVVIAATGAFFRGGDAARTASPPAPSRPLEAAPAPRVVVPAPPPVEAAASLPVRAAPLPAPQVLADPAPKTMPHPPVEAARTARREARSLVAAEPQARVAATREAPAHAANDIPSRCIEILQRASLGPLAAGEADSLRKGCE